MDIELLIKSAAGLLVLLAALVFLLLYSPKAKAKKVIKEKKANIQNAKPSTDLESLRAIIKRKKSTASELKKAIDMVLKYHGHIHEKLGIRAHPEFDAYMDMLFSLCRHPNTNKDLIVQFDKELTKLNPEYKAEINDAITKGLNSRGL